MAGIAMFNTDFGRKLSKLLRLTEISELDKHLDIDS